MYFTASDMLLYSHASHIHTSRLWGFACVSDLLCLQTPVKKNSISAEYSSEYTFLLLFQHDRVYKTTCKLFKAVYNGTHSLFINKIDKRSIVHKFETSSIV